MLTAYGADRARWPADQRRRLKSVSLDERLTEEEAVERELDLLLGASSEPKAPADLHAKVMATFPRMPARPGILDDIKTLVRRMARPAPAGAFAALGFAGFMIGAMTNEGVSLPPEREAYAYAEDAAFEFSGEEDGAWDVE